jgi:hypothetical protein
VLLAEIGESGQARIESGVAAIGGAGLAHDIATAYATRAGIGRVVDGPLEPRVLAPAFVEEEAARAVVAGSRAALAALRAVLGIESGGRPA